MLNFPATRASCAPPSVLGESGQGAWTLLPRIPAAAYGDLPAARHGPPQPRGGPFSIFMYM
jgi:hypothetical protein